jgi:superfamily II DNA or RNA helicase
VSSGLAALRAELERLAGELDPFVKTRGRPLVATVPEDLLPDPATGALACELDAAGAKARPSLAVRAGRLVGGCSCGSFVAQGQCRHLAALVLAFHERLGKAPPLAPAHPHALPRKAGCLAWRVRLPARGLEVVPVVLREPTLYSRKPPPRALALEDLAKVVACDPKGATTQDRTVAKRIERGVVAPIDLLAALEGHPRVAVEGSEGTFAVREATAGIAVVPADELYHVRPALDGTPVVPWPGAATLLEDALVAMARDEKALRFARVTPEAAALLGIVSEQGAALELDAAAALVDRIERAEVGLPLTLPPVLAGRSVPAARALSLLVTPRETGALIELRVRPIAGGPASVPGERPERFTAMVGGERLAAQRDLPRERASATELARTLAVQAEAPAWAVELASDDDLLDLLARLAEAPGGGEAVLLEWPEGVRPRRVVRTGAPRLEVSPRGYWLGLDVRAEAEGELVGLASVFAAAREGRRYATLGGGRFVEVVHALSERLRELARHAATDDGKLAVPLGAAPLVVAAALESPLGVEAGVSELSARVGRAREADGAQAPIGLKAELRPYQLDGYRWLARLSELGAGGVLADEMGLGKTVQAIALLLRRRESGPALVLAPTSVAAGWHRELARFARSLLVRSHRDERTGALEGLGPGEVVVATWPLLLRDREAFERVFWATLVLDEAQAFKNPRSETARAARALKRDVAFALTGTPIENDLSELWSIFSVVAPGLLGSSLEAFSARNAATGDATKDAERRAELVALVRPFLLRRTKAQVAPELPSRTVVRHDVELSPAERALYERARLDARAELASLQGPEEARRFRVFAWITRLRQLASHARLVDPAAPPVSSKLARLLEELEPALAAGRRALVFSPFVRHLELAREALAARGVATLTLQGDTPPSERTRLVDAFQSGEGSVFLISLKAGGVGLNLTAADLVFILDPWWNPAVEDQAADRAHRIGQERPVLVVRLVAQRTIEERVLELHERKRAVVASVLDGSDAAGRLPLGELMALLDGADQA